MRISNHKFEKLQFQSLTSYKITRAKHSSFSLRDVGVAVQKFNLYMHKGNETNF